MAKGGTTRKPDGHGMLVAGAADGWFFCPCWCGYVAVCLHCVGVVPTGAGLWLCDGEQLRLGVGRYGVYGLWDSARAAWQVLQVLRGYGVAQVDGGTDDG